MPNKSCLPFAMPRNPWPHAAIVTSRLDGQRGAGQINLIARALVPPTYPANWPRPFWGSVHLLNTPPFQHLNGFRRRRARHAYQETPGLLANSDTINNGNDFEVPLCSNARHARSPAVPASHCSGGLWAFPHDATSGWIWVEGEKPFESNMNRHPGGMIR